MASFGAVESASRRRLRDRLLEFKWFLEQEVDSWKYWVRFPAGKRLWLWRNGFTSPYGKLYDVETYGPDAFLSEVQRYRLYRAMNGRRRYLIDDKLIQHRMMADFPENRPDAYGLIDRGHVHGIDGSGFDGGPTPIAEWLPSALRRHSKLVLKHLRGKGGKEVLVCEYDDGVLLDGESVTDEALCDEVAQVSGYLATEYVHQHDYADALYPHAPNTIRLLTLWDDEAGEIVTPMAVHRIGTEQSRPIDNFSAGGVSAEIDLETGELGEAKRFPFSGTVTSHAAHPDTGARIEGTRVPHWEEIRRTIEEVARRNTNIPAIGWDVLLDESGTPVVLEANTGTDFDMMQVHRPLLRDRRVAEIVSRYLPEVSPRTGSSASAPRP